MRAACALSAHCNAPRVDVSDDVAQLPDYAEYIKDQP